MSKRKQAEAAVDMPAKMKKEQTTMEDFCVAGKSGKALANAVRYELSKAPEHVQKHYAEKLKTAKTRTSDDKLKFIKELLTADNYDTEFFNKMKKDVYTNTTTTENEWMSWKSFSDKEGVLLARAQVAQKSVETRPHPNLDPAAPSTLELPEEERVQYRYTKEKDAETVSEQTELMQRDTPQQEPATDKPSSDPDAEKKRSVLFALAKRSHSVFSASAVDFMIRLGKFESNEYRVCCAMVSDCVAFVLGESFFPARSTHTAQTRLAQAQR